MTDVLRFEISLTSLHCGAAAIAAAGLACCRHCCHHFLQVSTPAELQLSADPYFHVLNGDAVLCCCCHCCRHCCHCHHCCRHCCHCRHRCRIFLQVFTRAELQLIADLCIQHDCYALSDEVYEHLVFEPHEHISLRALPGMQERCTRLGSAGKTFSFTAWKVCVRFAQIGGGGLLADGSDAGNCGGGGGGGSMVPYQWIFMPSNNGSVHQG